MTEPYSRCVAGVFLSAPLNHDYIRKENIYSRQKEMKGTVKREQFAVAAKFGSAPKGKMKDLQETNFTKSFRTYNIS